MVISQCKGEEVFGNSGWDPDISLPPPGQFLLPFYMV